MKTGKIVHDIGLPGAMEVVLWAIARGLGSDLPDAGDEGNAPKPTGNRQQRRAQKSAAKAG
jgi:hypothetical protein